MQHLYRASFINKKSGDYEYFVVLAQSDFDARAKFEKELEKWAPQGFTLSSVEFLSKVKLDRGEVVCVS